MLEFLADIEEKGIEQSHELLHRVASYLHTKGFKDVEEFSLQGDAREELLYKLEKIHPDLVIMGYQGKTIIQRALIGSVSGHLVRNLKIPIIVAKQPSE